MAAMLRMIQRGERLRFARESRKTVPVMGEGVRENLESDIAIQLGVPSTPHLPHAAFADRRGDLIDAEARAWSEGQSRWNYKVEIGARNGLPTITP